MLHIYSLERCFSTNPYFFIFRMNLAFLSSSFFEAVQSYYSSRTRFFRVDNFMDQMVDFLERQLTRQDFLISLQKSFKLILRFSGLGQKVDCGSSSLYILQMSVDSQQVQSVLKRYYFYSYLLALGVLYWFEASSYSMRMFSFMFEADFQEACSLGGYGLEGQMGTWAVLGFILMFGWSGLFYLDLLCLKCRFWVLCGENLQIALPCSKVSLNGDSILDLSLLFELTISLSYFL